MKMQYNWKPVIDSLLTILCKHGYTVKDVDNGEELTRPTTQAAAVAEIAATDESHVWVVLTGSLKMYHLYLVLGNEPHELVADCSNTLPDAPLDEFAAFWEGKPCPEVPEADAGTSRFAIETTSMLLHAATLLGGKYCQGGGTEIILLPCGRRVMCYRWTGKPVGWTLVPSWDSERQHYSPRDGVETPHWLAAVIRYIVAKNDEKIGLCKMKYPV